MAEIQTKLKNPFTTIGVVIHTEADRKRLEELLQTNGFDYEDPMESNEAKFSCSNCGWEVRDHKENGDCPVLVDESEVKP